MAGSGGRPLRIASAAAGSKYEPIDGAGFLDVLEPLLARRDDVRVLVAGPSPDGRWAELERRGQGRALGLLPDVGPLLDAADVYVDSFPFASLTSMLEAAGRGVPVMSLRPPSDEPQVLGADTPELDEVLVVAESAAELCARIGELLDDGRRRDRLGRATRESMARSHRGGRWAEAAGRLLDTPVPTDAERISVRGDRRTGVLDERVLLVQAQVGISGEDGALLMNAGLLRPRERWGLAVRGARSGRRPTLPELVGTRWTRAARPSARWVMTSRHGLVPLAEPYARTAGTASPDRLTACHRGSRGRRGATSTAHDGEALQEQQGGHRPGAPEEETGGQHATAARRNRSDDGEAGDWVVSTCISGATRSDRWSSSMARRTRSTASPRRLFTPSTLWSTASMSMYGSGARGAHWVPSLRTWIDTP